MGTSLTFLASDPPGFIFERFSSREERWCPRDEAALGYTKASLILSHPAETWPLAPICTNKSGLLGHSGRAGKEGAASKAGLCESKPAGEGKRFLQTRLASPLPGGQSKEESAHVALSRPEQGDR